MTVAPTDPDHPIKPTEPATPDADPAVEPGLPAPDPDVVPEPVTAPKPV